MTFFDPDPDTAARMAESVTKTPEAVLLRDC